MYDLIETRSTMEIGLWVLIAGLLLHRLYLQVFRNRHRRYIRQAGRVLKTIRSFDGEHANQQVFAYLRKIDPFVFEELILTCFKEAGFKIIRNKKYTGDGGIDGRVIIDGALYLIQCKRYQNHIDRRDVEDLDHKVAQHQAKMGLFVHTGRTGKAAREWRYSRVNMISGQRLLTLLQGKYPLARQYDAKIA